MFILIIGNAHPGVYFNRNLSKVISFAIDGEK